MLTDLITSEFAASAALKQRLAPVLSSAIAQAASVCAAALRDGHKVMACCNGGSAADCQHFAAELVGRFELERPGLASIALSTDTSILTAVGNDYGFAQIFARQVQALGLPGDVLVAISTSGNSENVLQAVLAAHDRNVHVIALLGNDGGKILQASRDIDVILLVDETRTARIQEVHLLCLHSLCLAIDQLLMGLDSERV